MLWSQDGTLILIPVLCVWHPKKYGCFKTRGLTRCQTRCQKKLCLPPLHKCFRGKKKNTTSFFDSNWGFPKMVVPNNHGFPTKNDHFGVFWGYHHLRKHPILDGLHTQGWPDRTIELLHRPRKLMVLKSGKLTS